ncbi:MAG: DNA translocase FtsK 4TM domain-containing protein [Clostridia bacterium]|nr:DNA translocase FtsK 4TM domain-containing protein [Clostridia bacterium]
MARTAGKKVRKTSENAPRRKQKKVNYEIVCLIIIAVSILMGLSFFTTAIDPLGSYIKGFFMGLFGAPAYIFSFVLLGAGIHFIVKRDVTRYKGKYIMLGFLLAFISAFWNVTQNNFDGNYWALGKEAVGGGIIGGYLSQPIYSLCSFWGGIIVFLTLIIIFVIVIFEISVTKVAKTVYEGIAEKFYEDDDVYEEEEEKEISAKLPKEMKKEYKEIKKKIFDFEKELEEVEKIAKQKQKEEEKTPVLDEVMVTKEPDKEAITEAIDVAAETSLLPKGKKKEETETVEIEIKHENIDYIFPDLSLLREGEKQSASAQEALERTAKRLIDTLKSFGVDAKIVDYSKGPTVTRYELQPSAGVKISKITNLADDIALNLAASGVRIEPIAGKSAIGVEVPNEILSAVYIREVLGTKEFAAFPSKLAFALGKDISGKPVIGDIARMPHLLIAGSTGSGKSVCINTLITSILYKATPNEVKLVMIDPKVVELGVYNGIPHLLIPVVTDPRKAAGALQWAVNEMTNRYKLFADNNVRDLKGYNVFAKENDMEELPQIVIIIDELADLMMVAPHDVEDSICRLAQMARAAGMHLVIATQRPSVDVITGIIKANIPSRIAFAVSSYVDSRTIIDTGGAEKLLGRGDMLYSPIGASKPARVQGAFVTDKEVESIVNFVKGQDEVQYDEDVIEQIENAGERPSAKEERGGDADELLPQAVEMAIDAGQASVAMYQRRLKVGYQRAARLVDQMEARGIIGPFDGTKAREVLITKAQWYEMFMNVDTEKNDEENITE